MLLKYLLFESSLKSTKREICSYQKARSEQFVRYIGEVTQPRQRWHENVWRFHGYERCRQIQNEKRQPARDETTYNHCQGTGSFRLPCDPVDAALLITSNCAQLFAHIRRFGFLGHLVACYTAFGAICALLLLLLLWRSDAPPTIDLE